MRRLLCVLLLAQAIVVPGCRRHNHTKGAPGRSQEKNGKVTKTSSGNPDPVADNSRCYVCHLNYEDEALAVVHAQGNVGCVECHGESDAHCGDENNVIPPDIMYPKETINLSCLKCHERITNDEEHKPILAGTGKEEFCTDCHGEHRLAYRTQRWDRKTGELVPSQ